MTTAGQTSPVIDSRGASPQSPVWVYAIQVGLIAGLTGLAYKPVLQRIVHKWQHDGDWSHGWLVPLISIYFVYLRRNDLRRARVRTSWVGGTALIGSLLVYFTFLFVKPFGYPAAVSLVMVLMSIVLFLGGWSILRFAWFPVAFLLFAIPIPDSLYVDLTMPLRKLASHASAFMLTTTIPELHAGTSGVVIDYVFQGRSGSLNVEEACSGMRLMMAFITLGVAMAYLGDRPLWQRGVMVLTCVPIAVFCNILRVVITGYLHVFGHRELAEGAAHTLLGLAMLPVALGLFALVGYVLENLFLEDEEEPENRQSEANAPA